MVLCLTSSCSLTYAKQYFVVTDVTERQLQGAVYDLADCLRTFTWGAQQTTDHGRGIVVEEDQVQSEERKKNNSDGHPSGHTARNSLLGNRSNNVHQV